MTESVPRARLVRECQAYWRMELQSLQTCRRALGPELLAAFCGCFVQAERLASLRQLSFLSRMNHGRLSSARHAHTLLWFTAATLHELLTAVGSLRTILAQRGLLAKDGTIDRGLCAVQSQWDDDPVFKTLREAANGHRHRELIDRGLDAMEAGASTVVVSEGQGPECHQPALRLGIAAVQEGLPASMEDCDRFMRQVDDDQSVAALHQAFLSALESSGVVFEETDVVAAC